jgi:hypothetical protein
MRRRLAAAAVLLAAGCHDPVRDPYRPDPTPVPIVRPSATPAGYFPDNLAPCQWVPPGAAKAMLLATLDAAAGGEVRLEVDRLTDPDVILALRELAGHGAAVSVTMDDGDDGAMTANQAAFDQLRASDIDVHTPRQPGDAGKLSYPRLRNRVLSCIMANDTQVLVAFSGPLTPEGLAAPALVDLAGDDAGQAYMDMFYVEAAMPAPGSAHLADGPGTFRNHLDSWLAGTKTSLRLSAQALTDPALVSRLGGLAHAGVGVQVILPAGAEGQRTALAAAGVTEVRLAKDAEVPPLALIDGKLALLGAGTLTTDAVDHDRLSAVALDEPVMVTGAKAALDQAWSAAK